jgi:hypothetical protein
VHAARLQHLRAVTFIASLVALTACGGTDVALIPDTGTDDDAGSDATTNNDGATQPDGNLADVGADVITTKDAGNPYSDPGIGCDKTDCTPSSQLCCITETSYYPTPTFSYVCEPTTDLVKCAGGLGVYCDSDHDCPSSMLCCGDLGYQSYQQVTCQATCTNSTYQMRDHFCDPKAPNCDSGQTCKPAKYLTGYNTCQ